MSSTLTNYARALVKVAVGQILQTVGFQTTQAAALDILVEVLERYVLLISRTTHDFAELGEYYISLIFELYTYLMLSRIIANRTEPTLDDLACAFERHRVSLGELDEYINWVDTPEFRLGRHVKEAGGELVAPSQRRRNSREFLGFCDDPTHKELEERQSDEEWEHIYDYMPLMTRPQINIGI